LCLCARIWESSQERLEPTGSGPAICSLLSSVGMGFWSASSSSSPQHSEPWRTLGGIGAASGAIGGGREGRSNDGSRGDVVARQLLCKYLHAIAIDSSLRQPVLVGQCQELIHVSSSLRRGDHQTACLALWMRVKSGPVGTWQACADAAHPVLICSWSLLGSTKHL
jgi:hypothetical protein